MTNLQTFKNELFEVEAKEVDGQILFGAEQVSRNLGIVQNKNDVEYIRWERVNQYLNAGVDSPLVGKGSFIPESMVYMLAFKASNETALKFQQWLAIEVIPSIRKNGSYQKPLTESEQRREHLKLTLENSERLDSVIADVEELKNNTRIDSHQESLISTQVNVSVLKALGGKESNAYRELGKVTFAACNSEFKKYFKIPRRGELPKISFDEAIHFLEFWQPNHILAWDIKKSNNQLNLEHAFGNF